MLRTGTDAYSGAMKIGKISQTHDDIVIMPMQCGCKPNGMQSCHVFYRETPCGMVTTAAPSHVSGSAEVRYR